MLYTKMKLFTQDQAVLKYVLQCLAEDRDKMDAFAFQHLLIMVRAIAVARPGHLVQYIDGASAGRLRHLFDFYMDLL